MTRIQDTLDMSWLSDVLVGRLARMPYQHPVTGGGLIIFIVGELMGSQNGIVRMKCSVYFYSNWRICVADDVEHSQHPSINQRISPAQLFPPSSSWVLSYVRCLYQTQSVIR